MKTIANKTKATKSTEIQKLNKIKHKKGDSHKKDQLITFEKNWK